MERSFASPTGLGLGLTSSGGPRSSDASAYSELRELNDTIRETLSQSEHPTAAEPAVAAAAAAAAAAVPAAPVAHSTDFSSLTRELRDIRLSGASEALSSVSNSKAVLSALRSLQDKIQKLETEKAYYQELAHRVDKLEPERDGLAKVVAAMRAENENMQAELQLLRSEKAERDETSEQDRDQVKSLQRELSYVKNLAQNAQAEKLEAQSRVSILEVDAAACRELKEETARQQETIRQLESELAAERNLKESAAIDRERAEQSLRQLMEINSSLVLREGTQHAVPAVPAVPAPKKKTKKKTSSKKKAAASSSSAPAKGGDAAQQFPFVLGTSVGTSFSLPVNAQKVLGMLHDSDDRFAAAYEKLNARRAPSGGASRPVLSEEAFATVSDEATTEYFAELVTLLESELEQLRATYRSVANQLQDRSLTAISEDTLSQTLRDVVAKIEKKTEQLELVKRYHALIKWQLGVLAATKTPQVPDKRRAKALQILRQVASTQ